MKPCPPPDANPKRPSRVTLPAGSIDTHGHIFGPAATYPWNPARGYTPPDALPAAYEALHTALGVSRGVLTQPSVYGTDNRCMLDYVSKNLRTMRAVVAVDPDVTDKILEQMHAQGGRGIRVNIADPGGNPFSSFAEINELAYRLKPLGWHIEFLAHVHQMDDWMPDIRKLPVDISIGHFGYMPAAMGATHPKYQAFLDYFSEGRAYVKFTAPYRITGAKLTPYADVTPFAQALVARRPDRLVWGTDWPHPICPIPMPNDGDLADHLADWVPDADVRKQVLVANAERLFGW
jgi:2-pyrone-4,6-dicarboxylate lactonase